MSANAGSGQPSATIGKPSRRSTVATVRAASGLSSVRKFRQAAPPERRHRPPVYPATVRAAGTRASRGDRSTVCRRKRPPFDRCDRVPPVSDSGQCQRARIPANIERGQAVRL